ncbi:MAG: helix-turn-helix domain-containing protein [Stackebrandtia sp.]
MANDPGPTVRRRRLGFLLRELRLAKEMTLEQVGEHMEHAASWASRIERGHVPVKQRDLRDLLDLYECDDEEMRAEMKALAKDSNEKGWWNKDASALSNPYQTYIGLETAATELRVYDALVINGLFQIEDYARALLSRGTPPGTGEEADRKVKVRMARQARLNADPRLKLRAIAGEGALRLMPGGPDIQVAQLQHLRETAANSPNVSLQVLPFSQGASPGMIASFTLIDLPAPDPGLAYIESLTGGIFEEDDDADQYRLLYDGLAMDASSRADSIQMIDTIIDEIQNQRKG